MIELVTQDNIIQAAEVHAASWRESHRAICSAEFVALHTAERQMRYLQSRMEKGACVYLLSVSGRPVGVVSVLGDVIGDLYVLPDEQGRGYGTQLLRFAMERCDGLPTLWVLDHNRRAISLYRRNGFRPTGEKTVLSPTLSELQMRYLK
jgi:GNAT superfamily N-acetyltransferase